MLLVKHAKRKSELKNEILNVTFAKVIEELRTSTHPRVPLSIEPLLKSFFFFDSHDNGDEVNF